MTDTDTEVSYSDPPARRRRARPASPMPPLQRPEPADIRDPPAAPTVTGPAAEALRRDFPGCRPVYIARDQIMAPDRPVEHFEYWEAETGIAMVCDHVTIQHSLPIHLLTRLMVLIARARGSDIAVFGDADLLLRAGNREPKKVMQADQTVYLHPARDFPRGTVLVVDEDVLPDVVLEVDHTTDVRRRKLGQYEAWGFPEIWVEVPDTSSPSRPRGLRPGLTIHVASPDGFRTVPSSRAFPDWTATAIHRALNEVMLSAATASTLRRLGLRLGEQKGTGPDDDVFLRPMLEERGARARAEGLAEGLAKGAAQTRRRLLSGVVAARGLSVPAEVVAWAAGLEGVPEETLVRAALECRDAADFRQRLASLMRGNAAAAPDRD